MTKISLVSLRHWFSTAKKTRFTLVSVAATALSLGFNPALAGDPFRTSNPRAIGNQTEAAFKAMFEQGNYKAAKGYVEQAMTADSNEPMVYAMEASLAYIEQDLESMNAYAKKTREVAERIGKNDPLRSNIYKASSYFLEGAYAVAKQGTAKGAPEALNKLRSVFQYLAAAEKIDANDPELNLIKGYMDLMLATNLPFSNPNEAIQRLEQKAYPRHLAYRGMAVGYRDLKQYDQALEFVNKALAATPKNPEIFYLKAQILVEKSKQNNNNPALLEEARKNFDAALAKPNQLPRRLVAEMFFEQCRNRNHLDRGERPCDPLRDSIRDAAGDNWGPPALPPL